MSLPPATEAALPPAVTAALQLGWSIERLYRASLRPGKPGTTLPDRLPGVGDLDRVRRAQLTLDRVTTCLTEVEAALGWAPGHAPDVGPAQTALAAFAAPPEAPPPQAPPTQDTDTANAAALYAFRLAILDVHRALLIALNGNDTIHGKAYGLGRALADTVRPSQTIGELQDSFAPYRIGQVQQHLDDLASVLPAHAAKAVVTSLTWWRDVVYVGDDSEEGKRRRALVGGARSDAPPLRRKVGPNVAITSTTTRGDLTSLVTPLGRQGELWRLLLTGEKNALDLLTPDDYVAAARRAFGYGRRLALRTIAAQPGLTALAVVILTAAGAGVGATVYFSAASGGGRLAAYFVAIGGYATALGRVLLPRVRSAGLAAEKPLWGAAIDYVAAEAASVPPVGPGDRRGWTTPTQDRPPKS